MYSIMVNEIRASGPGRLNKGCGWTFRVGSRVRRETREYNNKNEHNSPKTLNDKNDQVSSQELKQLKFKY